MAEDGSKHFILRLALAEARDPAAGSGYELATEVTLEIIKAQAIAGLAKMHNKKLALADKLASQDGANSFAANADGHARTLGCKVTNDDVENKFATADYLMRTYRHISTHNVSGGVQQRSAHDYDRPLPIVSDRRKRKRRRPRRCPSQASSGSSRLRCSPRS